jgi:hypothetical protein
MIMKLQMRRSGAAASRQRKLNQLMEMEIYGIMDGNAIHMSIYVNETLLPSETPQVVRQARAFDAGRF